MEQGLAYNWHRFYDPTLGRYTQPDPLGFPDGPSRYAYAGASPVNAIDPRGTDLIVIAGGRRDGSFNIFGHIAIGVEGGGLYSFGNDTNLGSSVTDYLNSQIQVRDNEIVVIKTTPKQDQRALNYLNQFKDKNGIGIFPDNCANRTKGALEAAGITLLDPFPLPGDIRLSSIIAGGDATFIPQYGTLPPNLGRFDPRISYPEQ